MATIRITVLSGKTFRGVQHFMSQDYDCSTELARYAVESGAAIWNIDAMSAEALNDMYEELVGYRPQKDDPSMTDADLLQLCHDYLNASSLEG